MSAHRSTDAEPTEPSSLEQTIAERVPPFDTVRLRKDATVIDVALTVSPIRDRDRRIVGASKVARDIADRRAEAPDHLLIDLDDTVRPFRLTDAEPGSRTKLSLLSGLRVAPGNQASGRA